MALPTEGNVKSVEKQINVLRLEYSDFLFPLKRFQLSILLKKFQLDSIRIEIVSRGPIDLQNKEGPFLSIEKPGSRGEMRSLTKEWCYRIMENGERVLRSWMLYSPTNGCLYCFCCSLFLSQKEQERQSSFARDGFGSGGNLILK